ncbi:MAG: FimV/HubP family polar landmark protein [Wenzhouxiangella sp.]
MSFSTIRYSLTAVLAAMVLLFPADGLRALGLGEARVDSYLGQPLDVTIRLIDDDGSDSAEDLTVSPAGPDDYERLGIPAEALALGLDVSIDRSSQPPRVRLTSRRPVDDPIVRVLVNARWASGRVLREYTLFLDPPTVESPPEAERSESSPGEQTPSDRGEPEREESRPTTRTEPSAPSETRPGSGTETPSDPAGRVAVDPGDTLWSIASAWRPDTSLSMDQVMLAIFERNRQAFLGDNINRLRSDVELDMPSVDEVGGISRAEAEQQIRQHMNAWQQATPNAEVPEVSEAGIAESESETVEAPEADESESAEQEPESAEQEPESAAQESESAAQESESADEEVVHRLDVVPPEEDEHADGPVASEEKVRDLRGQVTDLEDEILAERLEGEEFTGDLEEIRELLASRDAAGVAVAEEMLAELEASLREARRERDESDEVESYFEELERELADGEDDDEADELAAAGGDDAGTRADSSDDETGGDEAATDAREDPGDTEAAVTEADDGGGSIWTWAGVGLLVIILAAVGAWLIRRRRTQSMASAEPVRSDPVAEARREVESEPSSLAGHLMLLNALADRGDESAFADALDNMYRQVEDENDGYWQEALSLAATHAPDHPLLTPPETPASDEDDIDRRAEEMMGMLEAGAEEEESGQSEAGQDSTAETAEHLSGTEEESGTRTEGTDSGDGEDLLDEDFDLSELSEALETPEAESGADDTFANIDEDLSGLAEDQDEPGEEPEIGKAPESGEADTSEGDSSEAVSGEAEAAEEDEGLDLDFEFSSSGDTGEIDDIFTESPESTEAPESAADEFDDGGLELSDPFEETPAGPEESSSPEEPLREEEPLWEDAVTSEDESPDETAGEAEDETTRDADEEPSETTAGMATLSDEDSDVKLDLARAYISVDLTDSARTILEEVVNDGSPEKQAEARKLLDEL